MIGCTSNGARGLKLYGLSLTGTYLLAVAFNHIYVTSLQFSKYYHIYTK